MNAMRSAISGFLLCEILLQLSLAFGQPSGFISIDCGSKEETYIDNDTGITYRSDSGLMTFGEIRDVPSNYIDGIQPPVFVNGTPKYLWRLRTFPRGRRHCYKLQLVTPGVSKYLLRTWFFYGNFDGLNSFRQFDLYLENTFVETVNALVNHCQGFEFIVSMTRSYLTLCLCKTNERHNPFISAIEIRPLPNDIYTVVNATLALKVRTHGDAASNTSKLKRYPYDDFDRIWLPFQNGSNLRSIATGSVVTSSSLDVPDTVSSTDDQYRPPSAVMQTAFVADFIGDIELRLVTPVPFPHIAGWFVCMHFAELKKLEPNETREFTISLDDKPWHDAFSPQYLTAVTICSKSIHRSQDITMILTPTNSSTLSPIINAMELFTVLQLSSSTTDDGDGGRAYECDYVHPFSHY